MATSIPIDRDVRDRLRTYGAAGMTYSQIITRIMDEIDQRAFVAELRRRADEVKAWVPLEDVE